MAKSENTEKFIAVVKLKLFNSRTREAILIADDQLVNYDVRLWRIVQRMM
jgi:hypothetical protein